MRQSSTRSAIYVVIGLGLLILTVSSLRRGDEASNASFVADSSPFEALKDYQPTAPLAEIAQVKDDIVEAARALPPVFSQEIITPESVPSDTVSLDNAALDNAALENMAAALPVEIPADIIENGINITANFVNTPKSVEMPSTPAEGEDSYYNLSLDDSETHLPEFNDETATSATLDSPITEPVEIQQETPAITQRASTEMPAFSSIGNNRRGKIINNHLASPAGEAADANLPADANLSNSAWKKNPFLTDAPIQSPSTEVSSADAIATDILPLKAESMILPEFAETAEELTIIGDLDPSSATPVQTLLPSVDHQTMQTVVAANENLEVHSPSIKIGISESDAQKAVHNIEYGKSLSRRGAAYAARQEFYASLRILAQSHDKQAGGTAYTEALRNGILAIKEAQDFIVTDTEAQIGLRVSNVIETHSTEIISAESAEGMTAIEAAQRYFAYASHQLSRCGGQNVVAAEALYCLGKLHSVQAKSGSNDSKLDLAKAMIYHQAAISSNDSNFRSLNELGVLYANSGRFDEAKRMLKKSLRIKPLPQAWQNLAVIHQRIGEHQLAQLAIREFEMTSTQAPISVIRWTPVEEFNENAPLEQHRASQASATLPVAEDTKPTKSSLKSLGNRILNSIR